MSEHATFSVLRRMGGDIVMVSVVLERVMFIVYEVMCVVVGDTGGSRNRFKQK